jgi:hypothetical protein
MSRSPKLAPALELLERRRLLSASLPNYANFNSTTGIQFNGYSGDATTIKHSIALTNGNFYEYRSAFYNQTVNIAAFSTTFSFASTQMAQTADGFTFTIQRVGPTALGYNGHDLGYSGIKDSVAVAFNLYNFDVYGSQFGFASKGKVPVTDTLMGDVNLHDGDLFTATVTYDGSTLTAKVVDDGHPSDVFTDSEAIDIPKIIGGSTAYVGFTGSTGVASSTQEISSWAFSNGPAISSLTASPATITKHTSTLTALATDPAGTTGLTYTWKLLSAPAGARAVEFSKTSSTANKTTVTVFSNGTYTFQVTVKDKNGNTATDDITLIRK